MLIGAIVLAGGSSTRMGEPKASLAWGDAALLFDRVGMLLDCAFPVVVVTASPEQELPPLDTECEIAHDTIPSGGPLVGVLTGMEAIASRCDAAFVVGCDFPFVDARTVDWLARQLGEGAGVVPRSGEKPQPLCALYRTSLLPDVKRLVEGGKRAAHALLDLPGVALLDDAAITAFDPERRFLWNINSREDYEQALKWRS